MKRMLSTKIIFPLTLTNNLMKDINECVFQDLCKIKPNKHKERLQAQLQTNSLLKPFLLILNLLCIGTHWFFVCHLHDPWKMICDPVKMMN